MSQKLMDVIIYWHVHSITVQVACQPPVENFKVLKTRSLYDQILGNNDISPNKY